MNSILISIKKMLGLSADYLVFDADIIIYINSAFMILRQLGVGPKEGFYIQGETETWDDFLPEDPDLYAVKTYIYAKVRTMFDPPQNGAVKESLNAVISEMEWRLNVAFDPTDTFD